jgi:hypothetical protein
MRWMTPLMFAAMNNHRNVVQILLAHKANIIAEDTNGQSAGDWAKKNGHVDIYEMLMDAKAQGDMGVDASSGSLAMGNMENKMERMLAQAAMKMGGKGDAPAAVVKSDVDEAKYSAPERPGDFAVVIGIEKYSDLPPATFAEHDAQAVRNHLHALGFADRNIVLLLGQHASLSGIKKYVETWLPKNVTENSTVFFYYSGHGAPDTGSGQAYLVPFDGDPQFLAQTAYPLKQLYTELGTLKAKQVIVAMDSCFSGAGGRSVLAKGTRPLVSKVDMGGLDPAGKLVAFSAALGDQISGTIDEQGHGAFTYYFLKGLNGAAADKSGAVTTKALYEYLKPKVEDAARLQNRDQMPKLMPEGGDTDVRLR